MIHRVDVEVGDVEQEAAAGPLDQRGQEVGLVELGAGECERVGDVLEDQRPVGQALDLGDVRREDVEGLARERQGGEVPDLDPPGPGERDVLAPPRRVEPADQPQEPVAVGGVEPFRGAEREVEPVGDQGVAFGQQVELPELLRRGVKVVVGDDFKEVDSVPIQEEVGPIRLAEPEPGTEHRQIRGHGRIPPWRSG